MRKSRFTIEQVIGLLKQVAVGPDRRPIAPEACCITSPRPNSVELVGCCRAPDGASKLSHGDDVFDKKRRSSRRLYKFRVRPLLAFSWGIQFGRRGGGYVCCRGVYRRHVGLLGPQANHIPLQR